jgi:DNA-binding MarR family transcriptional regulator
MDWNDTRGARIPGLTGRGLDRATVRSELVDKRDAVDRILEQWRIERPDLDPRPMGVVGRLSRVTRALERRLEPVFTAHGLDGGRFDVLATLRRAGPPYRLRPTDLFSSVMLTSSGMTKRLDRLEQEKLIRRLPDPGDRRGVLVELTREGLERIDSAIVDHVANEEELLGALTPAEQDRLARLLRSLLVRLEQTTDR